MADRFHHKQQQQRGGGIGRYDGGDRREQVSDEERLAVLQRLKKAQESQYPIALREIANGHKDSHWMWWIFPTWRQVKKTSKPEVLLPDFRSHCMYMHDDLLRNRLTEITEHAVRHLEAGVHKNRLLMWGVDSKKFHQTMSAFALAARKEGFDREAALFKRAVELVEPRDDLHRDVVRLVREDCGFEWVPFDVVQ